MLSATSVVFLRISHLNSVCLSQMTSNISLQTSLQWLNNFTARCTHGRQVTCPLPSEWSHSNLMVRWVASLGCVADSKFGGSHVGESGLEWISCF